LQAKLLRAIQDHTIERLGSNTPIHIDLRLITATSRDLEQAVTNDSFREDLYYRLNVVSIALRPLRERRQDIPALVDHFLHRGARPLAMTPAALRKLCSYHWPGNVRELENTVERARVLARGGIIDEAEIDLLSRPESSNANWTDRAPLEEGWKNCLAALEKSLVERAMMVAGGNKSRAAELLKIHRRLLYEKLREYGLQSDPE